MGKSIDPNQPHWPLHGLVSPSRVYAHRRIPLTDHPASQILHTKLFTVNDDRLALCIYHVLGGHARGRGFLYDLVFDQYTDFFVPGAEWTAPNDLNNLGRIVGANITANGATRKSFTYDCAMVLSPLILWGQRAGPFLTRSTIKESFMAGQRNSWCFVLHRDTGFKFGPGLLPCSQERRHGAGPLCG